MSGHAGIRAQLAIDGADGCPVADAATALDGAATDVRWARAGDGKATERVRLPASAAGADVDRPDGAADASDADANADADDGASSGGFRRVVAGADGTVAEFERDRGDCVCERIEALGCPVADVRADDGTLYLTVRVRDSERLRAVVTAAGAGAERVRLTYVVRGTVRDGGGDPVVVDRDRLTDRQREVLETAHRLGYFAHPREANAGEVAAAVGVAPSTFREHLAAAQGRLFETLLGDD